MMLERKEMSMIAWIYNSYRKTGSMMTAIKEACKAANRQITDPIAVSYFFFARNSALVPRGFAARPALMLSIYCALK